MMQTHHMLGEQTYLEIVNLGDKHKLEIWSANACVRFFLTQEELKTFLYDFQEQASIAIEEYHLTHNRGH